MLSHACRASGVQASLADHGAVSANSVLALVSLVSLPVGPEELLSEVDEEVAALELPLPPLVLVPEAPLLPVSEPPLVFVPEAPLVFVPEAPLVLWPLAPLFVAVDVVAPVAPLDVVVLAGLVVVESVRGAEEAESLVEEPAGGLPFCSLLQPHTRTRGASTEALKKRALWGRRLVMWAPLDGVDILPVTLIQLKHDARLRVQLPRDRR